MNIEQLKYIVEISKNNSLANAARKLHISQSAVSQAVGNLENELGVKLFNRSRNGTYLTLEGKSIVEKAITILNDLEELRKEASGHEEDMQTTLRIALTPGVMPTLVNVLIDFKKAFPAVSIEVNESSSKEIIRKLDAELIDIGLISEREIPVDQKLNYQFTPILQGQMVAFVHKNSSLGRSKEVDPEELKNYSFVLYDDDFIYRFVEAFTSTYGGISILFTTQNLVALTKALSEENVVTVGYDYSLHLSQVPDSELALPKKIKHLPDFPTSFGWVYLKKNRLSSTARNFMDRFEIELKNG
ncbi:LysR family transcriptional regulator [Radiobacillus sp. PE A8.2]|uniref:LysR family transcriptional regulator n=1 Tax=Radiobacillus sp. PE A8.2 TaxID=3380349 RepID=UPI00388FFBDD